MKMKINENAILFYIIMILNLQLCFCHLSTSFK